jgi:hypothetical protein
MTLREMRNKLAMHNVIMAPTDIKYQRGYKARRNYRQEMEEVLFVPPTSKRRRGQAYILAPRYDTTRYCKRIYFNVYYDTIKELGIL